MDVGTPNHPDSITMPLANVILQSCSMLGKTNIFLGVSFLHVLEINTSQEQVYAHQIKQKINIKALVDVN